VGSFFDGQWLLLGDFNAIMSSVDKKYFVVLALPSTLILLILFILMLLLTWALLVINSRGATVA
jgi:hypothetical protein